MPVYSLIYIYGLRHSLAGGSEISIQSIGEAFHILETDVLNAWKYWENQGLISMDTQGDSLSIEFLPLSEGPVEKKEEPKKTPVINVETRPQYTVQELSFYQEQSADITRLFSHGEQTLGKMLTYNDMNVLFGFYDWLRLPMDVIIYMLSYCSDNGHRDLRYIEKVALDWAEQGINSKDEAMDYTHTFDKKYRAVMRALGNTSAFPNPSQKKLMQKWFNELEMPLELILEACDKTVAYIGKPKPSYTNGILEDWNKKGIKTLEEVAVDDKNWKEANERPKVIRVDTKDVKKRNRFANFKSRERDFEQIERMEQEYLDKKYGSM